MIKNLTYIPYHDWRKIQSEGNRTRDAHFIDSFRRTNEGKLLIINRPVTYTELILKKKTIYSKLPYPKLYSKGRYVLYAIDENTFLIDIVLFQDIQQVINKRNWFFECYDDEFLYHFYIKCLEYIDITDSFVISANIFSYKFLAKLTSKQQVLFDAWDNFYLMPGMHSIKKQLYNAYMNLGQNVNLWVSNSDENIQFYKKNYQVKNISLVKNGVGLHEFNQRLEIPEDLLEIKSEGKILAGFGGKITHLFDAELFNYFTRKNSNINFVIIGQILDRKVFSKIKQRENIFYLGDKHYSIYPAYISNLDIGIVPYKVGDKQHGGDSIKVYEYLAAGLKVVGTNGNGLQNLQDYIDIANSESEFSVFLKNPSDKAVFPVEDYSWESKSRLLVQLLE